MIKVFISLVFIATTVTLTGCSTGPARTYGSPNEWVELSKQGTLMPLATKAGEWSYQKTFNTQSGKKLAVRSKFVKHHGTTCHYDVEFTNAGTTPLAGTAALSQGIQTAVYSHNSGHVKLAAGAKVTYNDLEARECPLKWGESIEMEHCASCESTILFAE